MSALEDLNISYLVVRISKTLCVVRIVQNINTDLPLQQEEVTALPLQQRHVCGVRHVALGSMSNLATSAVLQCGTLVTGVGQPLIVYAFQIIVLVVMVLLLQLVVQLVTTTTVTFVYHVMMVFISKMIIAYLIKVPVITVI